MIESVMVGISLFAVVVTAICIHEFLGDLDRHKQR